MQAAENPLKKYLTEFLCAKYTLSNIELENKLEDDVWKKRFNNWEAIRQELIPISIRNPHVYNSYEPKRGVTVILPYDDNEPDVNLDMLKAAAYFPFQIDPEPYQEFRYNENILIQLAFAGAHGYSFALHYLGTVERLFPFVKDHELSIYENKSYQYAKYYEFPIPEEFYGKNQEIEPTLPFDPLEDKVHINLFFDYLNHIVETGERNPTIEYKTNFRWNK